MQTDEVKAQALSLVEEAKCFLVRNDDEYRQAGAMLRDKIKPLLAEADRVFDPVISAAHAAHKSALAAKKEVTDPINQADTIVRRAMSSYSSEQLRRQREEQERLRREELAKREAAMRAEEERRLSLAMAAEQAGNKELAEEIVSQPAPVIEAPAATMVSAPIAAPKVDGVSTREVWRWEVVSKDSIRKEFLIPNESAIGALVRSQKSAAAAMVGGIRVWCETSTVVR